MTLSANQFAEIVERLGTRIKDRNFPGNDKRRASRVALNRRVSIILYVGGFASEAVGVELCDFSPRGIRFLHSQALERGDQFVLELPQHAGEPVCILCSVVHCKSTDEGPLSLGAEFTCVLPDSKPQGPQHNEDGRIRRAILG